jgi:hypothetical protein
MPPLLPLVSGLTVLFALLTIMDAVGQSTPSPKDLETARRYMATKMTDQQRANLKSLADKEGKRSEELLLSLIPKDDFSPKNEDPPPPPSRKQDPGTESKLAADGRGPASEDPPKDTKTKDTKTKDTKTK